MGKGSSESNTSSSSSTTNADQRVAASEQGVAIGSGAQYSPSNVTTYEFPDQVAAFANKLLDFAGQVLQGANETVQKGIKAGENATQTANATAAQAVQNSQLGNANVLQNMLPLIIIGVAVVAFITIFGKKG